MLSSREVTELAAVCFVCVCVVARNIVGLNKKSPESDTGLMLKMIREAKQ